LSLYSAELQFRIGVLVSEQNEVFRNRIKPRRGSPDPVTSWRNVRECESTRIVCVGFRHERTADVEQSDGCSGDGLPLGISECPGNARFRLRRCAGTDKRQ
jgi:hypothetical protein